MSTPFPATSLDTTTTLPTESANTPLSTNHVIAHTNLADAVIALETKVGVDSSAVATSLDYKVTNTSSSNPGHKHTLADGATDVTSSATELNVLDGIPATLTATELGYVDGVTSAIQTQLNAKAATLSGTTNEIAYFNASTTIASLAVATYPSLTELSYVKGVTSSIQNQISAIDANYFVGTGTATTTKTYNNFQIPWVISADVPTTNFWTATNTNSLVSGLGYIKFSAGADSAHSVITTNGIGMKITSGSGDNLAFGEGKDVICEFTWVRVGAANEQSGFGFATTAAPFADFDDASVDAACFTIDTSGNLYGHTSNGDGTTNHTETQITGITLTNNNTYRVEVNDGVDVKFYVNGILKATNTTTLPSAGAIKFGAGGSGQGNDNDRVVLGPVSIAVEK